LQVREHGFVLLTLYPNDCTRQVKNLEEYSFRPADVVTDIARIYVNFAEEAAFLSAVSRDGRSYSPGADAVI
jgi:ubiquitin conjugation factor E4 B